MSAITSPLAITSSPKWIISQRDDLVWFIGSALTGYFALAVISGASKYAYPLSVAWWALINNPHIFGTASRTYFDNEQRRKLSRLLWMILPFSIIPVLLVGVGLSKPLFMFAIAWGTFHVAKQHVGFVMLYKRKNNERGDIALDKWFLLISLMAPFVLFILSDLFLPVRGSIFGVALSVQILLGAAYLYRQVLKYRTGQEMNWPKLMLLVLIIPLHWIAFVVASNNPVNGGIIFTIGTNIGHAIQYHRLTWFHNKNRYGQGSGVSGLLSRSVVYYYGAAFGLYLLFVAVGEMMPTGGAELILMGPTFMHYLLDTKIWRVRGDAELAKALNVA